MEEVYPNTAQTVKTKNGRWTVEPGRTYLVPLVVALELRSPLRRPRARTGKQEG